MGRAAIHACGDGPAGRARGEDTELRGLVRARALMLDARIDRAVGSGIFGTDAAGYDGARPGYPEALFDRLDAYAGGLRGAKLFEVGAGTGIATRALGARAPA